MCACVIMVFFVIGQTTRPATTQPGEVQVRPVRISQNLRKDLRKEFARKIDQKREQEKETVRSKFFDSWTGETYPETHFGIILRVEVVGRIMESASKILSVHVDRSSVDEGEWTDVLRGFRVGAEIEWPHQVGKDDRPRKLLNWFNERSAPYSLDPWSCEFDLFLKRTVLSASEITELSGTMRFLVVDRKFVFVDIDNAKLGSEIVDDALAKAKIHAWYVESPVRPSPPIVREVAIRVEGDKSKIIHRSFEPPSGKEKEQASGNFTTRAVIGTGDEEGSEILTLGTDQRLLPGTRLKLEVLSEEKEVTIPFKFEGIPLP